MAPTIETLLTVPRGFRSREVARFVWQMDEQRRMLLADVARLTVGQLDWQPLPGMNTMGMLLAHIAYAESHLTQVGLEGKPTSDTKSAIGLSEEEEGLPLAPGATPPSGLLGRPLSDFEDMLTRARAHTKRVAAKLENVDLDRHVERSRPDGSRRVFNLGWVFFHLIEHEAGHRGQINLLRHLHRTLAER